MASTTDRLTKRRWVQWAAQAGIACVVLLFGSDIKGPQMSADATVRLHR